MHARLAGRILSVVLATLLPEMLVAQSDLREAEPARASMLIRVHAISPSVPAPHFFGDDLRAGTEVLFDPHDLLVTTPVTQRKRPWWLLPAIGSGAGAVGGSYLIYDVCVRQKEDCIFPVAPVVAGALVGAAVGGLVELVVRSTEYHSAVNGEDP